jgi:hypothetical protein
MMPEIWSLPSLVREELLNAEEKCALTMTASPLKQE